MWKNANLQEKTVNMTFRQYETLTGFKLHLVNAGSSFRQFEVEDLFLQLLIYDMTT